MHTNATGDRSGCLLRRVDEFRAKPDDLVPTVLLARPGGFGDLSGSPSRQFPQPSWTEANKLEAHSRVGASSSAAAGANSENRSPFRKSASKVLGMVAKPTTAATWRADCRLRSSAARASESPSAPRLKHLRSHFFDARSLAVSHRKRAVSMGRVLRSILRPLVSRSCAGVPVIGIDCADRKHDTLPDGTTHAARCW